MRFILIFFCPPASSLAQTADEYRVYSEHPRLFLSAQRLRLLKREHTRESMRWRQFDLLVKAAAQLPEPGFALSLYYQVTGDAAIGKRAVDWALGPGADLRQLALVYDWCQPLLAPAQSKTLAAKIRRLVDQKSLPTLENRRDRVLAVLSIADDAKHPEEGYLRETVEQWWRGQLAPALKDGRFTVPLHELFALLEILHALRDNVMVDLREGAPEYFKELPKYQVLGNYPAPLAAPENEYRVPVFRVGAAQSGSRRTGTRRRAHHGGLRQ